MYFFSSTNCEAGIAKNKKQPIWIASKKLLAKEMPACWIPSAQTQKLTGFEDMRPNFLRGDALSCLQKYLISADCQARELEAQLKDIFGPDEYSFFIKLPMSEKILKLQEMCLAAQQEGAPPASVSILRSHLDHLSGIDITSSLEPRSLFHPNDFDVVVTDVKEADFLSIGAELGAMRLSESGRDVSFDSPVRGIIFGSCQRLFVPLSVQKRKLAINVLFMFDTGSLAAHIFAP